MRLFLCGAILALCLSPMCGAQVVNSQQISGTVTDATGAVVPNATITITNVGTGLTREVTSNSNGNYVVLDIPVGIYTVAATAPGFKKFVSQNLHVDVGGSPSVPVSLQVGQAAQSVTVQADVVQIQTTTAQVGSVVTSEEATSLQLNGRNYVQLMTLSPGVSSTVASGFLLFGTYGVSGSRSPSTVAAPTQPITLSMA